MQTGRICGLEERITLRARYILNIKSFGESFDPSCLTVQRVHTFLHGCQNETFELHRTWQCQCLAQSDGGIHPHREVSHAGESQCRLSFSFPSSWFVQLCPCRQSKMSSISVWRPGNETLRSTIVLQKLHSVALSIWTSTHLIVSTTDCQNSKVGLDPPKHLDRLRMSWRKSCQHWELHKMLYD